MVDALRVRVGSAAAGTDRSERRRWYVEGSAAARHRPTAGARARALEYVVRENTGASCVLNSVFLLVTVTASSAKLFIMILFHLNS